MVAIGWPTAATALLLIVLKPRMERDEEFAEALRILGELEFVIVATGEVVKGFGPNGVIRDIASLDDPQSQGASPTYPKPAAT